jgi:CBS-domain-containing membrane protein
MRIAEVMTRDVKVIGPERSVREAARLMDNLNVGSLPVCDGERLVGMITDRDITVRATAVGEDPDQTQVKEIMTDDVRWCFEDDEVNDVVRTMGDVQIRRVPVVDRAKRLVGIVALGDLATERAEGTEEALRNISEPSEPDRPRNASKQRSGKAGREQGG